MAAARSLGAKTWLNDGKLGVPLEDKSDRVEGLSDKTAGMLLRGDPQLWLPGPLQGRDEPGPHRWLRVLHGENSVFVLNHSKVKVHNLWEYTSTRKSLLSKSIYLLMSASEENLAATDKKKDRNDRGNWQPRWDFSLTISIYKIKCFLWGLELSWYL